MASLRSPCIALLVAFSLVVAPVAAQPTGGPPATGNGAKGQNYCTNAPSIAYRTCPPPPPSQAPRESGEGNNDGRRDGNGNALVAIGAAAVIAAAIAVLHHEKPRDHASELTKFDSHELLESKGPQLSKTAHVGTFEVEGYVQGGWPLVFNVDAPPDASIYLKLVVDGVDQSRLPAYSLAPPQPAPPARGRPRNVPVPKPVETAVNGWYARVDLPRLPELDQPRRAWLQLVAVNNGQPVPLKVYALGAGPNAVGSVALTVDRFGPSPLTRKGDPRAANYLVRFHNQALFTRLVARIAQQRAVEQGGYQRKFVGGDIDLVQLRQPAWAPTIAGVWPGTGAKLPGRGIYDMTVVMFTPHGDWVLGMSPTPVTIQ